MAQVVLLLLLLTSMLILLVSMYVFWKYFIAAVASSAERYPTNAI